MITGIFMASGLSERMGQNKLLLDFKGKPLFQHSLESAAASQLDSLLVVTCYDDISSYCRKNNISVVNNPHPEKGQSQSIKLGVAASDSHSDFMFFVADQPLLKTSVINLLIKQFKASPKSIVIPVYKNTFGNPKIFPHNLRNEFLGLTEDVRGSWVIDNHPELLKVVQIGDKLSLFDIDTKEDFLFLSE